METGSPVLLAMTIGFILGKPIGIFLASLLAIKLRLGQLHRTQRCVLRRCGLPI